jgi:hypothetical protein
MWGVSFGDAPSRDPRRRLASKLAPGSRARHIARTVEPPLMRTKGSARFQAYFKV